MSQIDIQQIDFYFDAQAKNRFDYGYLGRKNGQILQLREMLLNLPEDRFEATFKSIETLVIMQNKPNEKPKPTLSAQQRAAKELYERTTSAMNQPLAVDEIRPI